MTFPWSGRSNFAGAKGASSLVLGRTARRCIHAPAEHRERVVRPGCTAGCASGCGVRGSTRSLRRGLLLSWRSTAATEAWTVGVSTRATPARPDLRQAQASEPGPRRQKLTTFPGRAPDRPRAPAISRARARAASPSPPTTTRVTSSTRRRRPSAVERAEEIDLDLAGGAVGLGHRDPVAIGDPLPHPESLEDLDPTLGHQGPERPDVRHEAGPVGRLTIRALLIVRAEVAIDRRLERMRPLFAEAHLAQCGAMNAATPPGPTSSGPVRSICHLPYACTMHAYIGGVPHSRALCTL